MKDSPKQKKKKTKADIIFTRLHLLIIILAAGNIFLIAVIITIWFVFQSIYIPVPIITGFGNAFIQKLLPAKSFENVSIGARAVVIYDTNARAIIYGKNQNLRFSPASTAKIMTALVALQYFPQDTIFTVPQDIYSVEGSKMGLFAGETISFQNLLYGLMLPSGNDAAYVLSTAYPGGSTAFIMEMNKKAKDLKLSGTYFVDPAGYEDGNYTTAFDLARLSAYALQNATFARVVSTQNILVYNTTGTIRHTLKNINELLVIPGVTGVKTGFTNEAEGVLVTSFETDGKKYIIVVLRSGDRFGDTAEVIERILNTLKSPQ